MKKIIFTLVFVLIMVFTSCFSVFGEMKFNAKSVILIDQKTGTVLYEQNADEKLPPASVTKIMTMLLVLEMVDEGKISLTDMVSVSENAASMGGSQVYLEVGETMSVDEMLKCVAVASANDAALALAEFTYGSEEAFVDRMNERARELGMTNTNFENTNGLDDTAENHVTSARDIAIMSRELLSHEKIFDYTTIWMDTVRNGEFGLTNTNRLIRFYKGANGLKTGCTSKAKFCISASALRDDLQLIAVVMASPTRDERNAEATKLLDYGFANYAYVSFPSENFEDIKIIGAIKENIIGYSEEFGTVVDKSNRDKIEKKIEIREKISAPIGKGDVIGSITYLLNGEKIGEVSIYAAEDVSRIDFFNQFRKNFYNFLLY